MHALRLGALVTSLLAAGVTGCGSTPEQGTKYLPTLWPTEAASFRQRPGSPVLSPSQRRLIQAQLEAQAAERLRLEAENQRLVASLFDIGFKPTELVDVLDAYQPAGGVDRALPVVEACSHHTASMGSQFSCAVSELAQGNGAEVTVAYDGGGQSAGAFDLFALNSDLRAFLAAIPSVEPVRGARVTSGFGVRRHPISRQIGAHEGTDFVSDDRTVRSAGDGVVRFASRRGGFGKLVIVEHPLGFETRYAHLSRIAVRDGQRVAAGQELGTMGSTGVSTGVHLHFEMRFRDRPLDPLKALRASHMPLVSARSGLVW